MRTRVPRAFTACAILFSAAAVGTAAAGEFSNTTPIPVPVWGDGSHVSEIVVEGLRGNIEAVEVTLEGMSLGRPDELELLLVSPSGNKIKLMSDVGGWYPLTGANVNFSANAAAPIAKADAIVPDETYLPSDYSPGDDLPAPAPAGYTIDMTSLNGTNPNGIWRLYAAKDGLRFSEITGGWTLSITTSGGGFEGCEAYSGSQKALCRQICEADRSRDQGMQGLENAWKKQFGGKAPCME